MVTADYDALYQRDVSLVRQGEGSSGVLMQQADKDRGRKAAWSRRPSVLVRDTPLSCNYRRSA